MVSVCLCSLVPLLVLMFHCPSFAEGNEELDAYGDETGEMYTDRKNITKRKKGTIKGT